MKIVIHGFSKMHKTLPKADPNLYAGCLLSPLLNTGLISPLLHIPNN